MAAFKTQQNFVWIFFKKAVKEGKQGARCGYQKLPMQSFILIKKIKFC